MKDLCTIIGVGPGLGRALALRFSQEYEVAMIARSQGKLTEYEQMIPNSRGYSMDIADLDMFRAGMRRIHETRPPRVLIYNAAVVRKNTIDVSMDDALNDYKVGVLGALVAVQETHMTEGSILLTGGDFGETPSPQHTTLSLAKAGINNLAQTLALSLPAIHVATVTIHGKIANSTNLDPHLIAEVYWNLHKETDGWTRELYLPREEE